MIKVHNQLRWSLSGQAWFNQLKCLKSGAGVSLEEIPPMYSSFASAQEFQPACPSCLLSRQPHQSCKLIPAINLFSPSGSVSPVKPWLVLSTSRIKGGRGCKSWTVNKIYIRLSQYCFIVEWEAFNPRTSTPHSSISTNTHNIWHSFCPPAFIIHSFGKYLLWNTLGKEQWTG